MACVDENEAVALLDGRLAPVDSAALLAHAAECNTCRELVAALAKAATIGSGNERDSSPTADSTRRRGESVGRYVILGLLGEGGMGVVYLAYDPDLDRRVALKFLHDAGDRQRLLLEAKAVAKLSHPNVVSVYDVGTSGTELYVAMEYVPGSTLREWLAEQQRSWRAVVEKFAEAGRGLAAAHAAGIIHRDFKPDNVIVCDDGRVRVLDFGLATQGSSIATPGGTPRYMAPEQIEARPDAGAAADQFSFCVALYEALYGQHPFVAEHALALTDPTAPHAMRTPPSDTRVAPRIAKLIRRGLARDPADRYPSLDALLAELSPRASQRKLVIAAGAAGAVAIAAVVIAGVAAQPQDAPCTGAADELAAVWSPKHKAAARDAFLASKLPYAAFAWNHAEQALDRYGAKWIEMHGEACRATSVRREQSSDVMDLRMSCLAQRRQELRATAELFGRADGRIVEKSAEVASSLSSLASCADIEALRTPMSPPKQAATLVQVNAVRAQLADIQALERSAKHRDAHARAEHALTAARAARFEPVVIEAELQLGRLEMVLGKPTAETTLTDAFVHAQAAGYEQAAVRAAGSLVDQVGVRAGRPSEGAVWARIARALLTRVHQPELDEQLTLVSAKLQITQGHYEEALGELRAALAAHAPDDPEWRAVVHNMIGIALAQHGKFTDALVEFRSSYELEQRLFGQDHPMVAASLSNIAATQSELGQYGEALVAHRRALAIRERAYGADDPEVATSLMNIGAILGNQGKADDAIDTLRRGIAIFEQRLGTKHPTLAIGYVILGQALLVDKQPTAAVIELRRALAIRTKVLGNDHPDTAATRGDIGLALVDQAKYGEAIAELEGALATLTDKLGADHPRTATILAGAGGAYLGLHDFKRAAERLESARAILERAGAHPEVLAATLFELAKAKWSLGDRDRAIALAHQSRAAFERLASRPQTLAEIETWLAAHSAHGRAPNRARAAHAAQQP